MDGFPRTLAQAEMLAKMLEERGEKIDYVLDIDVDSELIVRRLSNRRVCPKCKAVYNLDTIKTKVPGICDACGDGHRQASRRRGGDGPQAPRGLQGADRARHRLLPEAGRPRHRERRRGHRRDIRGDTPRFEMIAIRSRPEMDLIRRSGEILVECFAKLEEVLRPGVDDRASSTGRPRSSSGRGARRRRSRGTRGIPRRSAPR